MIKRTLMKRDGCRISKEPLQSLIETYAAIGVEGASFHPSNFGIIRKIGSDAWRPAPLFDFEESFGFSRDESKTRIFLANPELAKICGNRRRPLRYAALVRQRSCI